MTYISNLVRFYLFAETQWIFHPNPHPCKTDHFKSSEWVIKFNGLSWTADSEVHAVHISCVIIACTSLQVKKEPMAGFLCFSNTFTQHTLISLAMWFVPSRCNALYCLGSGLGRGGKAVSQRHTSSWKKFTIIGTINNAYYLWLATHKPMIWPQVGVQMCL